MSPELITAIAERIRQSHTKEAIKAAVLALGHSETVFEEAYLLAFQETKENIIEESEQPLPPPVFGLPKVTALVVDSFRFAARRLDLLALLIIPSALIIGASEVLERAAPHSLQSSLAAAVTFFALLAYVFAVTAVLYMASHGERVPYPTAWRFSYRNTASFLFLSLLTVLMWWGGLLFLIIPAFIVGVSLFFAPYALIHDGQKGMSALYTSRMLVQGRFWAVALRIVGFFCLVFLPVMAFGSLLTWYIDSRPVSLALTVFTATVFESFFAFASIMSMQSSGRLYRLLRASSVPYVAPSVWVKIRYGALLVGGVVMSILILIALVKIEEGAFNETVPGLPEVASLSEQMMGIQSKATSFYEAQNQSYEGVCSILQEQLSAATTITCNDESGEWAVSAEDGFETWCVDRVMSAKRIKQPLEERTRCIAIE